MKPRLEKIKKLDFSIIAICYISFLAVVAFQNSNNHIEYCASTENSICITQDTDFTDDEQINEFIMNCEPIAFTPSVSKLPQSSLIKRNFFSIWKPPKL